MTPLPRALRRAAPLLLALAGACCATAPTAPERPAADLASDLAAGEGPLEPWLGTGRLETLPLFEAERFPCVAVALDGTVVASFGSSRLLVRRSEDGGASFGPVIEVAAPAFQGGGLLCDERSGDLLAFSEAGHPPAARSLHRSRDGGLTWETTPLEVLPNSMGHSPSLHMNDSGITLRRGEHAGRLVRPTRWYGEGNDRAFWATHYTNAILSDDGGLTWRASEPFPEHGTGEATVCELADGTLYYNSRVHWDQRPENTRRRSALSRDGGRTWEAWRLEPTLPDGQQNRSYGCMGGLARLPIAGRDVLVFSNLDTPNATRERLTVWASFDGGRSWPVKRLVEEGPSAYSSLAAGRPGTPSEGWIYLQYEGGPGAACTLARLDLAWILAGEATGDGEVPAWARGGR
jgi:sialidase-1